jgi:hypothetical protein
MNIVFEMSTDPESNHQGNVLPTFVCLGAWSIKT